MKRLEVYTEQRDYIDLHASAPTAGTGAPAAKESPRSKREQYGLSAMIYGLVVLLVGIYCVMTDAGRIASEQGFAIEAAAWAPRPSAAMAPPSQNVSVTPLPTPLPRVSNRTPGKSEPAKKRSVPAAMAPNSQLEGVASPRYVKPRDGA